ncbi:glycosyltransferase [Persephonella sp.]|uniref:glycosyltransferase family 2 protein n=1 Tax=Persephonella sp. TaxID=2060922 RepID=UPI0026055E8C|nr:glycosyltransferase [Persephonella sp.]
MNNTLFELNVSKIKPNFPECLYFHKQDESIYLHHNKIKVNNFEEHSNDFKIIFNTFFGAFPVENWIRYTDIDKIFIEINAKGKFVVNIWADNGMEPPQRLKFLEIEEIEEKTIFIPINLRELPFQRGIIFPEIRILSPDFEMSFLRYSTEENPKKKVKLAIIMPTFKRETYVKRNVDLLQKELLSDKNYDVHLFVIDNGQTLEKKLLDKVSIIPNKNYGGAGGFGRGLLEVWDKDFTHILFSDDDIEFEVESIKRTINFFRYSKDDNVVIGGGMFNLNTKHILNEQGGFSYYMKLILAKPNRDMCNQHNVINFTYHEKINYFGWWFFATSKDVFKKYGFPLPIFFRGDDQEFGIRISKDTNFISLLGVGVWHEEFYKKDMPLTDYYIIRNNLILSMIHEEKSITLIKNLLRRFLGALLTYRYERAKFIVKGMEDFLKGASFIEKTKADEYHKKLMNNQKKRPVDVKDIFVEYKFNRPLKNGFLKKVFMALTLNGHLLPPFLIQKGKTPHDDGYVIEPLHSHRLGAIFRKETVLYYEPTTNRGIEYKKDSSLFFRLLFKGLGKILKIYINYGDLQKDYQKVFPYITSKEFWEKYLGIRKS